MKVSLLCTTDLVGGRGGASQVVTAELKAQARTFDDVKVIDGQQIRPASYGVPSDPFFVDYIASEIVREKGQAIDVAHFNGDPFGRTVEELYKLNTKCKIITDCPAHDKAESIAEWEAIYGAYPFTHMTNPFLWKLYSKHIANADIVLTPSKVSKKWLKKYLDVKARIIRHGTYIYDYDPLPSDFKVGYLGAIGPDKGLKYLFMAWSEINGGTLSFAGSQSTNLSDWKQSVVRANASTKINLLGFIENKWTFYRNIGVYVQPSVTEGFGIPILEAMSAGRAVIASKGAGASELIVDGKSGLLFEPRDTIKLIECINYLKDNPSEIKKYGDAARKIAKRYTWDKIEKKYIQIYKELL